MKLISKIKDKCIKKLGGYTDKEISEAYNSRIRIVDTTGSLTLEARAELYSGPFTPPEEFIKKELVAKIADKLFESEGVIRYKKIRNEDITGLKSDALTARIKVVPYDKDDSEF